MNFIFFSAVMNTLVLLLILSYDVACQFCKHFWTRMTGLPENMQLDPKKTAVWFKVPNFHLLGHKWPCHSPFSFHWMWGAGMTNGEDVEQNWEFTNGAAGSTKMMGPGGRHAFLEGLFAFQNWMRTVSYRNVFSRRMATNLKEAQKHREAFEAFTELLEGERPELVEKWKAWVKEWESEQHMDGVGSPFEMSKPVNSLKEIRVRLGKEELTRTGAGVEVERRHTSSTFITLGLEIEQTQRILTIDLKALANPSPLQELDFVKRKIALLKRIARFRKLQLTYMPELVRHLTVGQREIFQDKKRSAETVKLFMPSELASTTRQTVCEKGLDLIEEEMREAELEEGLEELRNALRARTATNRFRHRNTTALRVEWCKAYARMRRWHEDIVLVEEEMRRTIEFGRYMAKEWEDRANARAASVSPALAEGLRLREKARIYLAGVPVEGGTEVVVDVDSEEVDPTDEEGDVPGDEDVDGHGTADADEEDPDDV
ncbi:CxC2 domain-containing protein [Mycena venus]|uniref:CxC2 domain-containing protein n=1 Tax=Mycena venus TaxID=2733690 RepID=A0A8H7D5D2_9AGAR|nr:CxC2 domain-containing protein [Mycena venus]